MYASLACMFYYTARAWHFKITFRIYNQAIAGEYGAGSRGMCMLQAPSNHGQYNSSTCMYLYTIAFIYIASCVIMLCTIM